MDINLSLYHCDMQASNIRKARGLTQAELADRVGVEQPTISRFERGQDGITLKVIKDIAIALDVQVSDLLADDRSEAERTLVEIYRSLSPDRQLGWIELARTLASDSQKRS